MKRHSSDIIKYFLKKSPRNKVKTINKILVHCPIPEKHLPTDEAYIAGFIGDIELEDLVPSPYRRYHYSRPHENYFQRNTSLKNRLGRKNSLS